METVNAVDTAALDGSRAPQSRWPALASEPRATTWLRALEDLGLARRTVDAYSRAIAEYLELCRREGADVVMATRADIARYVRELTTRPHRAGSNVLAADSGSGLSNATIQQRLVAVRLFYDHLMEEGVRDTNPVGRGRYTPSRGLHGHRRGLVPRFTRLPWIPNDTEWQAILVAASEERPRNRVMLAFAYDAALRREELCTRRTSDIDPAHRTLRVRAEATKNRLERSVPYSAAAGQLLIEYLRHRRGLSLSRGPLFLSESRRNPGAPITAWTWSKVVRHIALRAGLPRFTTHTLRHLCLTDLARADWELHAIATFAGHRSTMTRLQYIHLSGRELAARLSSSMSHLHAWRTQSIADLGLGDEAPD